MNTYSQLIQAMDDQKDPMDNDEQKNANDKSSYSLSLSVIQNKLNLHLLDTSTKYMYHHASTPQNLNECGFSDKQIKNLDKISNFIATAKSGHDNLKFTISIAKNENPEGLETCSNIAIITIMKQDDFFGTMTFILKLQQIPRKQPDINQDYIQDLKAEIMTLKQQLLDSKKHEMPKGSIIMWSGNIDSIPNGWKICDGTENTPDLRNRFIIGAGSNYNINSIGGNITHSHDITVNGHQLTVNEMPSHHHGFYKSVWVDHNDAWRICNHGNQILSRGHDGSCKTKPIGGNAAHSHTASSTEIEHLPPYFAMAFIMKII